MKKWKIQPPTIAMIIYLFGTGFHIYKMLQKAVQRDKTYIIHYQKLSTETGFATINTCINVFFVPFLFFLFCQACLCQYFRQQDYGCTRGDSRKLLGFEPFQGNNMTFSLLLEQFEKPRGEGHLPPWYYTLFKKPSASKSSPQTEKANHVLP